MGCVLGQTRLRLSCKVDECKPPPLSPPLSPRCPDPETSPPICPDTSRQGLTLVHFSAQRKRFPGGMGYISGLFKGCLGGVRGYQGVCRVYFVSETAQVELTSERV